MSGLRNTKLLFNVSPALKKLRILVWQVTRALSRKEDATRCQKAKKRISWLKICRKGSIVEVKRNRFVMLKKVRAALKASYRA